MSMTEFADMHIHLLAGTDDGARTAEEMKQMIDHAYRSGTRVICCTPHFHPGYFGDNAEKVRKRFASLKEYVSAQYPDLELYLGNELRYSPECLEWLNFGQCNTLNGTDYLLIDFSETERERTITAALYQLLNAGWQPVLAHAERYSSLHGRLDLLQQYLENGIVLQADTQSVFRKFGFRIRRQCLRLLDRHMIDLFSSDAHNCGSRPPEMDACYAYIRKKYGKSYADRLFYDNACMIMRGEPIERIRNR